MSENNNMNSTEEQKYKYNSTEEQRYVTHSGTTDSGTVQCQS